MRPRLADELFSSLQHGRRLRLPTLAQVRPRPLVPQQQQQQPPPNGAPESVDSPSNNNKRRSVIWDSLWSLDLSYESGRKGK